MAGPHNLDPMKYSEDGGLRTRTGLNAKDAAMGIDKIATVDDPVLVRAHTPIDLFEDSIAECKQKLVEVQELYRRMKDLCDSLERGRTQDREARIEKDAKAQWRLDIKRSVRKVYGFDTTKINFQRDFRKRVRRIWDGEKQPVAQHRRFSASSDVDSCSSLEQGEEHTTNLEGDRSSNLPNTKEFTSLPPHRLSLERRGQNSVETNGASETSTTGQASIDINDQLIGEAPDITRTWPLEPEEYKRYGRQLILPEVGLQGQLRLRCARVLIVGAGGLGCPAAAYLAGAGVGTLGIVDGDTVELSNLHRQILHTTDAIGILKAESAITRLKGINSLIKYTSHKENLNPENALGILSKYDIVLDCTDRPTSRYLISDTCVILARPLVSASALRTDGQLTILNYPVAPAGDESGGPCYRCVWPRPPPAETVVSCGEGGILGPVVGVMGVLMALEALKIITGGGIERPPPNWKDANGELLTPASTRALPARTSPPGVDGSPKPPPTRPTMLLLSATSPRPFQIVRLQPRRKDCPACSANATITAESLTSGSTDYVAFCGVRSPVRVLRPEQRLTPTDYAVKIGRVSKVSNLVDVREKIQYDLCHMPGSINVPWSNMEQWEQPEDVDVAVKALLSQQLNELTFVCREGNDSQLAVRKMQQLGLGKEGGAELRDITGGWEAWRRDVDTGWPQY